jgi:uncharacterized phage protein (TIGR01671 family)
MNRDIKFRGWDNQIGKMFIVGGLANLDYDYYSPHRYAINDTRSAGIGNGIHELNHTVLMQYTGIKDRNGREIYESDIVQVWYGSQKDGRPQEVRWNGFCFLPFNDGCGACGTYAMRAMAEFVPDPNFPFIKPYTIEVIGNIYENPDLLPTPGYQSDPGQ